MNKVKKHYICLLYDEFKKEYGIVLFINPFIDYTDNSTYRYISNGDFNFRYKTKKETLKKMYDSFDFDLAKKNNIEIYYMKDEIICYNSNFDDCSTRMRLPIEIHESFKLFKRNDING